MYYASFLCDLCGQIRKKYNHKDGLSGILGVVIIDTEELNESMGNLALPRHIIFQPVIID